MHVNNLSEACINKLLKARFQNLRDSVTIFYPNCIAKIQSWARVPGFAFPRFRVPGVLGTWARGNEISFNARGNAEREEVGTLILRA